MDTRETVVLGGTRIAYRRAGSGPPLVLLHGIGGNADQWREQLAGLAGAFDVIAWDAPGYVGSDDPERDWGNADYAAALAGFLDALGLDRVHLVGQSWGGVIAQGFAGRHPQRLRSLTLANTFIAGAQPEEDRRASRDARLRALAAMTPAEMAEGRVAAVLAPDPPAELRREVVDMLAAIRPSGYRAAANAIYGADERGVLPRIALPVLVVAGDRDAVVPLERAEQLAAAIPGARLAVFPGSGHLTNQEQPRRFDRVLCDFLAGVDA